MEARVIKNLNIRTRVPEKRLNNLILERFYRPGDIITISDTVIGEDHKGNNVWYRLKDGCFVWSGGVETGMETKPLLSPISTRDKISFNWFKQLNIETVWETFQEKGDRATVAVLDTGLDFTNPDLRYSSKKLILNYPASSTCNTTSDLDGHGTRCASIIGGRNLFQHNVGIAPECNLLIGKISCKQEIRDTNSILEGIKWSLDNGAEIISISYGIKFSSDSQKDIFHEKLKEIITDKKVLIFSSAGNTKKPAFGERYPASFPECISVGASDNKTLSTLTLQSDQTLIHAPGINIESYSLNSKLSSESGTSYSTPIVAGITALAISYSKKINNDWNPDQIIDALYKSGLALSENKKDIQPLQFLNYIKS